MSIAHKVLGFIFKTGIPFVHSLLWLNYQWIKRYKKIHRIVRELEDYLYYSPLQNSQPLNGNWQLSCYFLKGLAYNVILLKQMKDTD